jgi:hypothetical protein
VRDRQTVLRGQLTELFMGEAHNYRMRIIIKQPRTASTENLSRHLERTGTAFAGDGARQPLLKCALLHLF